MLMHHPRPHATVQSPCSIYMLFRILNALPSSCVPHHQAPLAHLNVRKIHLRMLRLELPHNLCLLLLIAAGLSRLLLPLIIHHLLDHAAGLAVQIAELAVLGRDFADVDARRRRDDVLPPLHLVGLRELDAQLFGARGRAFQRPGGVVEEDGVGEVALQSHCISITLKRFSAKVVRRIPHLDNSILPLDSRLHAILRNLNIQILALEVPRDLNRDFEVGDRLRPFVGKLALLFLLFGFGGFVEALALRGRG